MERPPVVTTIWNTTSNRLEVYCDDELIDYGPADLNLISMKINRLDKKLDKVLEELKK